MYIRKYEEQLNKIIFPIKLSLILDCLTTVKRLPNNS